jgi:hypothetical protein
MMAKQEKGRTPGKPKRQRIDDSMELIEMRFLSSRTEFNPAANGGKLPPALKQRITVKSGRSTDGRQVQFLYGLSLFDAGDDGVNTLNVEATIAGIFKFATTEIYSDEGLSEIGQKIGLGIIWPFWREFVHSMAGRMLLPALKVPLLNAATLRFGSGENFDPESSGREGKDSGSTKPAKRRRK